MNAQQVIEAYISEVALQVPRRQRNDLAFELRALLQEGMQDQAEEAGRPLDGKMATEFLRAFGHPDVVAARYRPSLLIIDPEDGKSFVRWCLIGLAILWSASLLARLAQAPASADELLRLLGAWWLSVLQPSLAWLGILVLGYGGAAWTRRRWPEGKAWQPRALDRIQGGRSALALGLLAMLGGLLILLEPRWLLDLVYGGRAAPAAYEALSYAERFRQRQGPVLLGLLALYVPTYLIVLRQGRWSLTMRRLETSLGLAICAAMAWAALDGPIFIASRTDATVKPLLAMLIVYSLLDMGMRAYRRVRPQPAPSRATASD